MRQLEFGSISEQDRRKISQLKNTEINASIRRNTAAVDAGKRFFHEDNLNRTAKESFALLGKRSVVSEQLHVRIRASFDWERLQAFSPDEIKQAAIQAGLTVYDSEHKPPYAEISVRPNMFMIVLFEQEKRPLPTQTKFGKFLDSLGRGFRPRLEYNYSALFFDEGKMVSPPIDFTITGASMQKITFSLINVLDNANSLASKTILEKLIRQLHYEIPPIDMDEPIHFINVDQLNYQEKAVYFAKSYSLSDPHPGVFFLQSELKKRK